MSHQSPYAMHPRPSRAPEHAAAFGGNAVRRGQVQRAMKLFLISGLWVTGLFTVVAAVTMVAVATAPIARNSSAAVPQQALAGQPPAGRAPPVRASAPARIQAVYLGLGSADTSQFTIGGAGTWKLGWSYDCAGTGSPGTFTVSQFDPGSRGQAYVDRRGMAGHGVSWARHDSGIHYLAIRTRCRWRLTVASHP